MKTPIRHGFGGGDILQYIKETLKKEGIVLNDEELEIIAKHVSKYSTAINEDTENFIRECVKVALGEK